jgi:hypothetical protein
MAYLLCLTLRGWAGFKFPSVRGVAFRGASIPGYPSLTVGYPTEFQKGGIDIPPGVKMLGCQLAHWQAGLIVSWPSNCRGGQCRNYGRQVQLALLFLEFT